MKYFIDTEFIEGDVSLNFGGFNIPKWLIKPNNTVQLISVALVSSDNREYYAISKDFNLKEAWNRFDLKIVNDGRNTIKEYWIRENVLKPIYKKLHHKENITARQAMFRCNIYIAETDFKFTYKNLKYLINKYGKTNKQIAEEIRQFCLPTHGFVRDWYESKNGIIDTSRDFKYLKQYEENFEKEYEDYQHPKFYGYYCDYDWVVFCWLFGKMIDLPKGFPMFAFDIQQQIEEYKIDK